MTGNDRHEELPEDNAVDRREFLGTSVAAASWWALTAKTDALAQGGAPPIQTESGEDPTNQNYHYQDP